jgi:hypothetical protein
MSNPAPVSERPTSRRVLARVGVLVPVALVLAFVNGQLAFSARTFDNLGLPRLKEFAANPVAGPRWRVVRVGAFPWSRAYFGDGAAWVRYRVDPRRDLSYPFTVWADSIVTPDLGALRAFPVRDCYDFHDYSVSLAQRVDIGGVVTQLLVFADGNGLLWHALTWEWPVRVEDGSVEHERMTLLASSLARPGSARPLPGTTSLRDVVLSAFNVLDPDQDINRRVSQTLQNLAADMIAQRITVEAAIGSSQDSDDRVGPNGGEWRPQSPARDQKRVKRLSMRTSFM